MVPNTSEYEQYDGLETGALASCTGVALYIPHGENSIVGIGHLAPSQDPYLLVEQFREQLRETGINFHRFQQQRGFMEVVPGQTTYDREKGNLRDGISVLQDCLKEQFPNLISFPARQVSYSVLRGHLSSSVKLLKDGRLIISGEGKAY